MARLVCVCILVLSVVLPSIYGQGNQIVEWGRENYPNPQHDLLECGREGKRSYICDPNLILSVSEANQLELLIQDVANNTKCPCASHYCAFTPKGYHIGVALMKKMATSDDNDDDKKTDSQKIDSNLDNARLFAYSVQEKWELGECKEDVIILYSEKDNVIYTTTGSQAAKYLSVDLIGEISMKHRVFFLPGADRFSGLRAIIQDYKDVFNGKYVSMGTPEKPKTGRQTNGFGMTAASVFNLVFVTVVGSYITLAWE